MYEVFLNECLLGFPGRGKNSLNCNKGELVELEDVAAFYNLLSAIEKASPQAGKRLVCSFGPALPDFFPDCLRRISAAGGLVADRQERLLFIRRWGRWDLPKGAVETGETAAQAALREVREESGLRRLELGRRLQETSHLYRSPYMPEPDNWVLKQTSWFEMRYHGNETPVPQQEEAIEDVRWFGRDEMKAVLASTYASLQPMLCAYLKSLR